MRKMNLSGRVFGRLTAIEECGKSANGKITLWMCRCECGNTTKASTADLNRGHSRSCGCLQRDSVTEMSSTHGMSNTKIYKVWKSIKARCCDQNNKSYPAYGGRGIKMCDRWLNSFEAFLNDMGYPEAGTSLDRKNNNGDYTPENCRWATPKEQARNTRRNRLITHQGKSMCLSAWAEELNVPRGLIKDRLRLGWSVERALQAGAQQ